jgi:Lon protease-like protein
MAAETTVFTLPVFPLNTVLFPGMPIALHIFEERYKQMVQDLQRGDGRFCVALIRQGVEVGGVAEPHRVACIAWTVQLHALADGRYNMLAMGEQRVEILDTDRASKPYLLGTVRTLPDLGPAPDHDLASRVADMFLEYTRYLMSFTGRRLKDIPLPVEPEALSYILAGCLQVTEQVHQRLLELPGCAQRLQAELDLLRGELPVLRALIAGPKLHTIDGTPFSTN